MADPVTVDVISDVVCPWCYIGKKRLDQAIAAADGIEVVVRWRPYQLDPTIPPEGLDRKAYMLAKFGSEERLREIHARIEPLGTAEGIHFDLDAIKVSPNTLDAHRLIRWAQNGPADAQGKAVAMLFSDYFEQGKNVGDHGVLLDVAEAAGLDRSIIEPLLASDADKDAVREEIATAARMGVRGVPCFLLNRKYAVMGAQDVDTLTSAIRQVAQEASAPDA